MRLIFLIMGMFFSAVSIANEFDVVKEMSKIYLKKNHAIPESKIMDVYLPFIKSPTNNSKNIESVADVTLRAIKNKNVNIYRLQYVKILDKWQFYRELNEDEIFTANPILRDEYTDIMWRESSKLEIRVSNVLQDHLRQIGKVKDVKKSRSRCFISIKYGKALCDAWYSTWEMENPECITEATAFQYNGNKWTEIPGNFHGGMRVNPENGEIFEMIPRKVCGS